MRSQLHVYLPVYIVTTFRTLRSDNQYIPRRNQADLPLQWRTQELCSGGVQQIQLRTENRQNGDLGAVAPQSGVLEAAVILYKKFHFI
jgi:hypothetical protein